MFHTNESAESYIYILSGTLCTWNNRIEVSKNGLFPMG